MAFVNRFFIWDTETTSNKPTEDDIISIGGVLCNYDLITKEFTKIDEFHTYVHTNKKIDTVAQSIHHISKSDLYGQPEFPDAVALLQGFLTQYQPEKNARLILVAHNGAKFDDIILYCNFVQHRLNFDQFLKDIKCHGFLDSLKYFRLLFKGCSYKELPKDPKTGRVSFALGHCYTSFCGGTILENAHDALVDSQALFEVCNAETLKTKICSRTLFKAVVSKKKATSWVKQTAGVSFQNQEHHTRMMQANDNMDLDQEQGNGPHDDEEMKTEPIFESPAVYAGQEGDLRLCLNCMMFVRLDSHLQCFSDPQPLTRRVEVQ